MTCTTTPATASRSTETTLREDHDNMIDYARTLAIAAGLIPEVDRQRQPRTARSGQRSRARLWHNGRKPKGPMCDDIFSVEVAAPTVKRGIVMSELIRRAPARAGMVAGKMGLPARMAARLRTCHQHLAHPLRVMTHGVVPKSPVGAKTMTQAYATLARTAAPIITLASRRAAPIQSQADTTDPQTIALHVAAENALSMALSMLRNPAGTAADLERATARAIRAATLLKRACAAKVEGGAA